jgi:hypothetical protein
VVQDDTQRATKVGTTPRVAGWFVWGGNEDWTQFTVKLTVAEWVRLPLVPVMLTV